MSNTNTTVMARFNNVVEELVNHQTIDGVGVGGWISFSFLDLGFRHPYLVEMEAANSPDGFGDPERDEHERVLAYEEGWDPEDQERLVVQQRHQAFLRRIKDDPPYIPERYRDPEALENVLWELMDLWRLHN